MQNPLQSITLIYVGPAPQEGVRLPAGSVSYQVQPFAPFRATNSWLRRMTGRSSRFWTPTDFEDHCRRCADGQLRAMLPLRKVSGIHDREAMIAALCEGIHGDPSLLVYMESDLRVACAAAGLPTHGSRAELLERLGLDEVLQRVEPADAPEPVADDMTPESEPEPVEAAKPAAKLSALDVQQLAQLKAALAADDYQTVWSVGTNLTSTRPASKSKTAVYEWAEGVIRDLEG